MFISTAFKSVTFILCDSLNGKTYKLSIRAVPGKIEYTNVINMKYSL